MSTLSRKLEEYRRDDTVSFHMPGHKERGIDGHKPEYEIDITEIDGFDDLHHPEGVILDEMRRAARLYGAKEAFLLVGGSTAGNMAGVFCCTAPGDKILMARNCHKSIYNAVLLRRLSPIYVNPSKGAIQGAVSADKIEELLCENPDTKLVVITSPTYDGVVSDIKAISDVCHAHGLPLMVDAAHGAHFEWSDRFPQNPIREGADIAVISLHKTLPSMTSTALMLTSGSRIERELALRYLGMFQTSSPSYVLLNSISQCLDFLSDTEKREASFCEYVKALDVFYENVRELKKITIASPAKDRDFSKIIIIPPKGVTGVELKDRLLTEYKIHLEMATVSYALALSSVCDKSEQLDYLLSALKQIDSSYKDKDKRQLSDDKLIEEYSPKKAMNPGEVEGKATSWVELDESVGRVCAQNVIPYPPGVPLLVTGEIIESTAVRILRENLAEKIRVEGLVDGRVCVVNS